MSPANPFLLEESAEGTLLIQLLAEGAATETNPDTPCQNATAGPYCTARCDTVSPICKAQCGAGVVTNDGSDADRMNCNVTCGYENNQQTYADHKENSCVDICPAGTVAKTDTNSTTDDRTDDVGDCTACTGGHFANHNSNQCRSAGTDCPAGSTATETDTDADGVNDVFDCKASCPIADLGAASSKRLWDPVSSACVADCSNAAHTPIGTYRVCMTCAVNGNNKQTFADQIASACVEQCPVGAVAVSDDKGTSDLADDTFECTACDVGKFSDQAIDSCVDDCSGGSYEDDATNGCTVCGRDDRDMQLYADHDGKQCVLRSDCPNQDANDQDLVIDDGTHDCGRYVVDSTNSTRILSL